MRCIKKYHGEVFNCSRDVRSIEQIEFNSGEYYFGKPIAINTRHNREIGLRETEL